MLIYRFPASIQQPVQAYGITGGTTWQPTHFMHYPLKTVLWICYCKDKGKEELVKRLCVC